MNGIGIEASRAVVTISIDRPPQNLIGTATARALVDAIGEAASWPEARCVILQSRSERVFCAGIDPRDAADGTGRDVAAAVREVLDAIIDCPLPVIAAVNGPAFGAGLAIAAAADMRIASERATFGMSPTEMGRCGCATTVGRLVASGALRLMYFTGQPISAFEAHRIGLVDRLVAPRRLMPAAREIAAVVELKNAGSIREAKATLNALERLLVAQSLSAAGQPAREILSGGVVRAAA